MQIQVDKYQHERHTAVDLTHVMGIVWNDGTGTLDRRTQAEECVDLQGCMVIRDILGHWIGGEFLPSMNDRVSFFDVPYPVYPLPRIS